jgi:2,3-bisphosphoglycerate-dependent phosphoglycerate mutase
MRAHTTTLCLIRHGETAWNAERRIQGQLDIPLNLTGEAQARATATALQGQHFDAAFCSDLARAHATALAATERLGIALTPDAHLRERHYGLFQGLTYAEAEQRHPEDFARHSARDPDYAFPNGGESLTVFRARIHAAIERISDACSGGRVLIVTHGGVLDILHRLATGKPLSQPRDFALPNAALNWIVREPEGWRLLRWADQTHLAHTRDELPRG